MLIKPTKQNHDAKQQTHKLERGQFTLPFWFDMTRANFMFFCSVNCEWNYKLYQHQQQQMHHSVHCVF